MTTHICGVRFDSMQMHHMIDPTNSIAVISVPTTTLKSQSTLTPITTTPLNLISDSCFWIELAASVISKQLFLIMTMPR